MCSVLYTREQAVGTQFYRIISLAKKKATENILICRGVYNFKTIKTNFARCASESKSKRDYISDTKLNVVKIEPSLDSDLEAIYFYYFILYSPLFMFEVAMGWWVAKLSSATKRKQILKSGPLMGACNASFADIKSFKQKQIGKKYFGPLNCEILKTCFRKWRLFQIF